MQKSSSAAMPPPSSSITWMSYKHVWVLLAKAVFLATFILQVLIWPSPITLVTICTYGLFELVNLVGGLYRQGLAGVAEAMTKPGVVLTRWRRHGDGSVYTLKVFLWLYFAVYFGLFINHELATQPWATFWLPVKVYGNTSFKPDALPPFDVTSDESKAMRASPYVWQRHLDVAPPLLAGVIPGAGPGGAPLVCPTPAELAAGLQPNATAPALFACFLKAATATPPSDAHFDRGDAVVVVPLPDQLYYVDVQVTPPAGVLCKDLEVYRVVLDQDRNLAHGLDLPSSSIPVDGGRAQLTAPFAPVFGDNTWRLAFQHTFTQAQYKAEVAARCEAGAGSLVFRLPSRTPDVDEVAGKLSADVLLTTAGAHVRLHAGWKSAADGGKGDLSDVWLWTPWRQLPSSQSDAVQAWRESASDIAVFFKFFIAATPVLYVWYFLAAEFQGVTRPRSPDQDAADYYDYGHSDSDEALAGPQQHSQVPLLCLFVLMPAALLFLSIGAWVPMAGSVVCALAVNHSMRSDFSRRVVRPALIFLSAACNSIQFAWLIALIAQAGFSAFFFEGTLRQLYSLSSRFIVSETASPTWTTIVLPCVLTVNAVFMLSAALCVVLETLVPFWQWKR